MGTDDWLYLHYPGRTELGALGKRAQQGSYGSSPADCAVASRLDGRPMCRRHENEVACYKRQTDGSKTRVQSDLEQEAITNLKLRRSRT